MEQVQLPHSCQRAEIGWIPSVHKEGVFMPRNTDRIRTRRNGSANNYRTISSGGLSLHCLFHTGVVGCALWGGVQSRVTMVSSLCLGLPYNMAAVRCYRAVCALVCRKSPPVDKIISLAVLLLSVSAPT